MVRIQAHPFDFDCDLEKTALLLISMQKDYMVGGGYGDMLSIENNVEDLEEILHPVETLLDACRANNITVIYTRECHSADHLEDDVPYRKLNMLVDDVWNTRRLIGKEGPSGWPMLIHDKEGAEIMEQVAPLGTGDDDAAEAEAIVDCGGKNAFLETDLDDLLRDKGIDSLIVAGVLTDLHVNSTVREAYDRGYRCLVISNACASYNEDFSNQTMDMFVSHGGLVAVVTQHTSVCDAFGFHTDSDSDNFSERSRDEEEPDIPVNL